MFFVVVVYMVIDTCNYWCYRLYQNPGEIDLGHLVVVVTYSCLWVVCVLGVERCVVAGSQETKIPPAPDVSVRVTPYAAQHIMQTQNVLVF